MEEVKNKLYGCYRRAEKKERFCGKIFCFLFLLILLLSKGISGHCLVALLLLEKKTEMLKTAG